MALFIYDEYIMGTPNEIKEQLLLNLGNYCYSDGEEEFVTEATNVYEFLVNIKQSLDKDEVIMVTSSEMDGSYYIVDDKTFIDVIHRSYLNGELNSKNK